MLLICELASMQSMLQQSVGHCKYITVNVLTTINSRFHLRAGIAGFPETNVLGCIEGLRDWHGLSGYLRPTAWWEKERTQFHHDGAFSASSPPPPAFVAM